MTDDQKRADRVIDLTIDIDATLEQVWQALTTGEGIARWFAPHAAVTLLSPVLDHIIFGSLIGFAVMFVAYFALLGALFDLDQSDTWYCICVIILVQLAVYFGLLAVGAVV